MAYQWTLQFLLVQVDIAFKTAVNLNHAPKYSRTAMRNQFFVCIVK